MSITPQTTSSRVTLRTIRQWVSEGSKFPMLTCYDATTARWLWRGGVKTLLVGDSASQVILGYDQSIFVPLDFLITLTAGVRRGAPDCFLMGDMPFMSYQADEAQAITNAGRFLTEGLADAVKLEVDHRHVDLIAKLSRAGIPAVAHIGWRPQMVRYEGIRTAKVAGKTHQQINELVSQAVALEEAGAVMLLVEQCTAETASRIVESVSIPVIGCGAGPACHGHVVVLQDLLGMTDHHPTFVQPVASLGPAIEQAAKAWKDLLASGQYLAGDNHPYKFNG
jgi:3-methyl-2-oxobutanoate hydroxymethyltransferase